jgi:hypothetical protein
VVVVVVVRYLSLPLFGAYTSILDENLEDFQQHSDS